VSKGFAAWAALLVLSSVAAQAETACRVLDFEIAATYSGGCVAGLADGEGAAEGPLARYEGGFKAGRKHGRGVKAWRVGDRYEGEFRADLRHGQGTYVWGPQSPFAGERYSGAYVDDRRHGIGRYDWPNGEHYDGPWEEDKLAGQLPPRMQLYLQRNHAIWTAVRKPDIRVCREYRVGHTGSGRFAGRVKTVLPNGIVVQLEEVGEMAPPLGERTVALGDTVLESPFDWRPCY